jgi:cholesterol oxidase
MKHAAEKLGRSAQFGYPNIAVDFHQPDQTHKNKFNVEQTGCTYCGECDIGCNIHAKNTLDLNYLAEAEQLGAEVTLLCEVDKIAPAANGYRVEYQSAAKWERPPRRWYSSAQVR